jgi:hypothetical protein
VLANARDKIHRFNAHLDGSRRVLTVAAGVALQQVDDGVVAGLPLQPQDAAFRGRPRLECGSATAAAAVPLAAPLRGDGLRAAPKAGGEPSIRPSLTRMPCRLSRPACDPRAARSDGSCGPTRQRRSPWLPWG